MFRPFYPAIPQAAIWQIKIKSKAQLNEQNSFQVMRCNCKFNRPDSNNLP